MIGAGLKKYAEELGLEVSGGRAYGVHNGYMLSFYEGSGYKAVTVALTFPDESTKLSVEEMLCDIQFKKDNGIGGAVVTDAMIDVRFNDTVGTLKIMKNAVEVILTKLAESGIGGVEYCNACHCRFDEHSSAEDVMIDGNVFRMHSECIDSLSANMAENAERIKQQGSIGGGIAGAFLGAIVGVIPWALASYFGWFVAVLGLIVGIASKKGYELFGGKQTKLKPIAVLISSLIAVVAAEFVIYVVVVMASIAEAGMAISAAEAIELLFVMIAEDSAVSSAIVTDLLLSFLFVVLGIFNLIKDTFRGTDSALAVPVRLGKKN